LNINDPVGMYLETETIPNVDSTITIKNLLRHRSGLSDVWDQSETDLWTAVWGNRDSVWSPGQVLSYIPSPYFGLTTHKYADTNTYLLSFIIEAITGMDLETVFNERIFDPPEMNSSYLSSCKSFDMSELNGVWNGDENRSAWSHNSYLSSRAGNSALISTPMDVAKFYSNYYRDNLLLKTTMDSLRVPAAGSRISVGMINNVTIHHMYGYETSILETVLANQDTVMLYGHGGNGVNTSLSFHWPAEDITIVLVQNDFSILTLNTLSLLFFDVFNEILNDLQVTGIKVNKKDLPETFGLFQNYPNPFNPSTTISFYLPHSENVTIEILSSLGHRVDFVLNKKMTSGNHTIRFDGSRLSSGIYFYMMTAGNFIDVKKMLYLK